MPGKLYSALAWFDMAFGPTKLPLAHSMVQSQKKASREERRRHEKERREEQRREQERREQERREEQRARAPEGAEGPVPMQRRWSF